MKHGLESHEERYARGVALREATPREKHRKRHQVEKRSALKILAKDDRGRLKSLLPLRYKLMSRSPFAFLRGAASVMARDLVREPVAGVPVQACGDCHLMNFGVFASPENNILFDVNDFDETLGGVDFTIDVKRLAASVVVAAFDANMNPDEARAIAAGVVAAYRIHMDALARMPAIDAWNARIDAETELEAIGDAGLTGKLEDIFAAARESGRDGDEDWPKLSGDQGNEIAEKPPKIRHFRKKDPVDEKIDAEAVFAKWRKGLAPERRGLVERYELKDAVLKAVGVGSVGTLCGIGLFKDGDGNHLFLQIKEARRSALEQLAPDRAWRGHQGERVIAGQRMLQAASDVFLGAATDAASGREFYVRALKNRRLGEIGELTEVAELAGYASLCGRALARAHARSGDAAIMAGYMGSDTVFDEAIASFAMKYAKQNEADHAELGAWRRKRKAASKKKKT